MSFIQELRAAYTESRKSKLYTQTIKNAILQSATNGYSSYTHYFDRTCHSLYDVRKFCAAVEADYLRTTIDQGNIQYYVVEISGWEID